MKMLTETNNVVSANIGTVEEFKIKASPKAFAILSSNLYTDKPAAILRELSCNAWDAHVVANTTSIPFIVHLPNLIEPFFSIRDFGTGIPPEKMGDVYCTLFQSTKDQTNDQTGCLGLGCKTPLSYVDMFTVESFIGGKCHTFSVFKNEQGIPSYVPMGTSDSTEPSGLKVSFPVKASDFYTFQNRAAAHLNVFPVLPTITGSCNFDFAHKVPTLSGNGWRIYSKSGSPVALMGNVRYPIDTTMLWVNSAKPSTFSFHRMDIEIDFPIGDLDFAASREALSYDKITVANLEKRIGEVLNVLEVEISKQVSSATTLWDARNLVKEMNSSLGCNVGLVNWKGSNFTANVRLDDKNIEMYELYAGSGYGYAKRGRGEGVTHNYVGELTPRNDMRIFFDDTHGNSLIPRRIKGMMLSEYRNDPSKNPKCFLLKSNLKEFIEESGIDPSKITNVSTLQRIRLGSVGYNGYRIHKAGGFVYNPTCGDNKPSSKWTPVEEIPEGAFIVVMDAFRIDGEYASSVVYRMLERMKSLELPIPDAVYGVRRDSPLHKEISTEEFDVVDIVEYVTETVTEMALNDHDFFNCVLANDLYRKVMGGMTGNAETVIYRILRSAFESKESPLLQLNDEIQYAIFGYKLFHNLQHDRFKVYRNILNLDDIQSKVDEELKGILTHFSKFIRLNKHLDKVQIAYNATNSEVKDIIEMLRPLIKLDGELEEVAEKAEEGIDNEGEE